MSASTCRRTAGRACASEGETFAVGAQGARASTARSRRLGRAPRLVAIEATGGFEMVVAAGLAAAGLPVVVVNPAQVRAFAQALGKRAKTDPIDAAVIARFAEATRPQVRPLPDEGRGFWPIWSPGGGRSCRC